MFAVLAALCLLSPALGAATLGVQVDQATGGYNVTLNNVPYFVGLLPSFTESGKAVSPAAGNLKLTGYASSTGADGFGEFTSSTFSWTSTYGTHYETSIRLYDTIVVFGQTWVDGASGTATNTDALSGFPSFDTTKAPQPLGFLAYNGAMVGWNPQYGKFGESKITGGTDGTGPLVLFSTDLSTSFVLSPASNFMAASQAYDDSTKTLSYGVLGSITSVPAQFTVETIIQLGSGVNSVMQAWGDRLLHRYGKERYAYRGKDLTVRYLGYSTDNGAYYYYNTENNETYEQTLEGVYQYSVQQGLPYKWILLDSWWYPKGPEGGVITWDAMPSVFPHGLDAFFNATGWSIQGHNRYWSNETTYATQNGGPYNFLFNDKSGGWGHIGVPTEQEFWDFLMETSKRWGLAVYEQDWLNDEFDNVDALRQDAQLGRQWLLQMGRAADKYGLTIQYCMSLSRHILQSLEIPAVTQARASTDYHPGATQWTLGVTSIFAHAVGIAPTKDNYWSTSVQPGNPYKDNPTEPYNRLQSAVSTLSAGPVAPSDKIGYSDAALILKACMADGTLLSHIVPATSVDATFPYLAGLTSAGPQGEVWTSGSVVGGQLFGSVFVANLNASYALPLEAVGYPSTSSVAVIEANTTSTVTVLGPGSSLTAKACGRYDFQLYSIAPVLPNGWALIGETAKWVPVNSVRFSDLSYDDDSVTVTLNGAVNEAIVVSFYNSKTASIQNVSCKFGEEGTLVATVPTGGCWAP